MSRSSARPRGFTLLELMVSAVVMAIVLGGIAATFIATQQAYQQESQAKLTTENARQANSFLDGLIRLAGYGIDPRFAFDFTAPNGLDKDNFQVTGLTPVPGLTAAQQPAVITDDLAFRYRNPGFLRRGFIDGNALNLVDTAETPDDTFGVPLRQNQPLLVACRGGSEYALVRAGAAVGASATTSALGEYGAPFAAPFNLAGAPACTRDETNPAYVMLVHDVRVRIMNLEGRPFLVAFNNLDDPFEDTNTDFDPIAADVESFQVAYIMNRPASGGLAAPDQAGGNGNWIMGDTGDPDGTLPDPALASPQYGMSYEDLARFNGHPGNIRGLRMTVVTRSPRTPVRSAQERFTVENMVVPANPPFDGFYRSATFSAVRLSNMMSRSFFTPPLRESALDPRDLNFSGG